MRSYTLTGILSLVAFSIPLMACEPQHAPPGMKVVTIEHHEDGSYWFQDSGIWWKFATRSAEGAITTFINSEPNGSLLPLPNGTWVQQTSGPTDDSDASENGYAHEAGQEEPGVGAVPSALTNPIVESEDVTLAPATGTPATGTPQD